MPSLTRILLLGTLTRPTSFRQTGRGTPICRVDLRVDAPSHQHARVIRIVIFGKRAAPVARHLGRGGEVLVAGV